MGSTLVLDGRRFTLADARAVLAGEVAKLGLSPAAWKRVKRARGVVDAVLARGDSVYGVNTGFGKFQSVAIPPASLGALQVNLLRSHAAGVGPPLSSRIVRLILALRANTLARGHSGVSPAVLRLLLRLYEKRVYPVIPSQGSVGASGDLAPLSHLALVLIGEGRAIASDGSLEILPGDAALERAGLKPVTLRPKDALGLINGTQVTNAIGLEALVRAHELVRTADVAAAMSHEALRASVRPFLPEVHEVRPHPGQAAVAANMRRLLRGSRVPASHRRPHGKVQDAYSIRCVPQVHGAARDALVHALEVALREANSTTDNPLVFPGEKYEIVSAGNFHAEPLALAFDYAAMAAAEIASISERRTESLVNPDLSGGLPAFLAAEPGLESGCMLVQVTAASLVSENKVLCHPASVDSIPTSGGQEDHVSMGTHAARKFGQVVSNAEQVLACELYSASRALQYLGDLRPGKGVMAAWDAVRRIAPIERGDRSSSTQLRVLATLVGTGWLAGEVERAAGPLAGLVPAKAPRRRTAGRKTKA